MNDAALAEVDEERLIAACCSMCGGPFLSGRTEVGEMTVCSVACQNRIGSFEPLRWDGTPKRRPANYPTSRTAHLTIEARDELVEHIARLRARLRRYEPDGPRDPQEEADDLAEGCGTVQLGGSEDPALRAEVERLQHENAALRADRHRPANAPVAVDGALRQRLEDLPAKLERLARAAIAAALMEVADAGRAGRADTAAAVPVAVGHPALEQPRQPAPERAPPAAPALDAVLEPRGVPPGEAADARLIPGINRPRPRGGWFTATLARMGGAHTAYQVAAADNRPPRAGTMAAVYALSLGSVERCGNRGRQLLYRLKV